MFHYQFEILTTLKKQLQQQQKKPPNQHNQKKPTHTKPKNKPPPPTPTKSNQRQINGMNADTHRKLFRKTRALNSSKCIWGNEQIGRELKRRLRLRAKNGVSAVGVRGACDLSAPAAARQIRNVPRRIDDNTPRTVGVVSASANTLRFDRLFSKCGDFRVCCFGGVFGGEFFYFRLGSCIG